MSNLNQWDIKQIIDVVSKGINSILMSKPDISDTELFGKAKTLVKIYQQILNELKEIDNGTLDFPIKDESK